MRAFAAQHLLPAECGHIQLVPRQVHRESGRGGIANRQALAVCRDRIAIRQAAARCGAVPCEHDIAVEIDRCEINNLAIRRDLDLGIQLELFDGIGYPAFAKAFPCQHFHRARTKQCPHCHLDRAGI